LLAAHSNAGFVQFIVAVTNLFMLRLEESLQSQHQRREHIVVANRYCDNRLRHFASGNQWPAAHGCASQDSDLVHFRLPIAECRFGNRSDQYGFYLLRIRVVAIAQPNKSAIGIRQLKML